MIQRTKRLAVYLTLGSSLLYQCGPEEDSYQATLKYFNETNDTIYFNPIEEDSLKSPLLPNANVAFEYRGSYFGDIRDSSPFKLKYFRDVMYGRDSCDSFNWLPEKNEYGPTNLYNYEIKSIGEDNFDMTFRFTEELKKRAKPCE